MSDFQRPEMLPRDDRGYPGLSRPTAARAHRLQKLGELARFDVTVSNFYSAWQSGCFNTLEDCLIDCMARLAEEARDLRELILRAEQSKE